MLLKKASVVSRADPEGRIFGQVREAEDGSPQWRSGAYRA